jgi:hypothetical protein
VLHSDNIDDTTLLDPEVDMDKMLLFTTNPEHLDFNIERGWMQYRIEFHQERLKNGYVHIYPLNPYYFDKHLTLASSRQFRYVSYVVHVLNEPPVPEPYHIITEPVPTNHTRKEYPHCENGVAHIAEDNPLKKEFVFRLPSDFAFCDEKDKYMVFVRGRRIDYRNFLVAIPETSTPFEFTNLYVNIPLEEGDRIDIFYLPDRMEETIFQMHINPENPIIIDRSLVRYNLSKNLYTIFMNGKKLMDHQMEDMGDNKLKLIGVDSSFNLTILKHIEDIEVLAEIFDSRISDFDDLLNDMDVNLLRTLYNIGPIGTDASFKDGKTVEMRKVLAGMVRDYWLRPYVVSGDIFKYNYITKVVEEDGSETQVFEVGSDGEAIINANDLDYEIV